MNNTIAIIPARGGSKRIPRKNIKPFCGHPIIKYSIDAALESGAADIVMVSTDCLEIAEVARSCGAEVPFLRSEKNSNDQATTADALNEVLDEYEKRGRVFEYVCCLYPTAPFAKPAHIRNARDLLVQTENALSVVPVLKFPVPIEWAMKVEGVFLAPDNPEQQLVRSQDLEAKFYDAGQFYFFKTGLLRKSDNMMGEFAVPLYLDAVAAQDIDTEEDWIMAEMKYRLLNQ